YIVYSLGNISFMAFLAWCWFLLLSRTKFTESFLGQLKFCFYAYIFIYLAVLSLYGNSLNPPVVGVINNTIYPAFSVPAAFRFLLIFSLLLYLKQKQEAWTQRFALSHLLIFCLAIYLIYTSSAPAYLAIFQDLCTSLFNRFIDNHEFLGVGIQWKLLYYNLLMQDDLFQSNIIWSDVLLLLYSKGVFVAAAFLLLLCQGLKTAINSRPITLLSVVLMVTPLASFFSPVLTTPLNMVMYAICLSMLKKSESKASMLLIKRTWERLIPKLLITILLLFSSWILVNVSIAAVKVYLGPVRLPVTEDYKIPDYFIVQLVATEDRTFFQHKGLCHLEIRRSLSRNLKALRFERGASTISMQLAKLLYLNSEKTLSRKLQQILIAIYLERVLNKGELLYRYISLLDFGEGRVGLKDASNYYFHKDPSALSFRESALLVASVVNPKIYRPEGSNKDTISRAQAVTGRASLIYPVLEPQARALPYVIAKDENSPNNF
ncbi:MAG: transglycosylase domain-containing protein, partial [SAR324 cluster bacterium]|nr:transglycosylase domain-containing protein [SAR324 cluster bacterium]